jgi:hypothetical protein
MGEAARALEAAHSGLDVDKVQDLKDIIAEQQDKANEIANVFIQDAMLDDDELLKELEELEQENLNTVLIDLPPAAREKFPQVITDEPTTKGELFFDNFLNVQLFF